MAFEPQEKTFILPVSKKEIVYRGEKVEDDVIGMKIASEATKDAEDRSTVFYVLQKVKVALCIKKLDGRTVNIRSYKEYVEVMSEIMTCPQDFKVLDTLFLKMNGDSIEAEAFVKNLLNAPAS